MRLRRRRRGRYDGPVCYSPHLQTGPDGTQLLAGWHYSTRQWRGMEIPDRRLHLNDDDPDNLFYEYAADDGHRSWVEKHGVGNVVQLGIDNTPE